MMARRLGIPVVWVGAERFAAGTAAEASGAEPVRPSAGRWLPAPQVSPGDRHRARDSGGPGRRPPPSRQSARALDDLVAGQRRSRPGGRKGASSHVRRLDAPERRNLVDSPNRRFPGRRGRPGSPPGLGSLLCHCATGGFLSDSSQRRRPGDSFQGVSRPPSLQEDIRRLTEACRSLGGDAFITTEKDAVKLTKELRDGLRMTAPLLVATLQTAFVDPDRVLHALEARLA